jgi:hypothetical protein
MAWTINEDATNLAIENYLGAFAIFLAVRTVAVNRRSLTIIAAGIVGGWLFALYELLASPDSVVRFRYDVNAARIGLEGLNQNYLAYSFARGVAVVMLLWGRQAEVRRWPCSPSGGHRGAVSRHHPDGHPRRLGFPGCTGALADYATCIPATGYPGVAAALCPRQPDDCHRVGRQLDQVDCAKVRP